MKLFCSATALLTAGALIAGPAAAQDSRPTRPKGPRKAKAAASKKAAGAIKAYDKVITEDAWTKRGLFAVHKVDKKLYYEIPRDFLGEDMLWVVQIEKTGAGSSYGGMPAGNRVIRWELRDDAVLLRDVKYRLRSADETDEGMAASVGASSLAPIITVFPVKAWGEGKAPVIDVTNLFLRDVPEFSARRALGAGALDSGRSFIEEVKAFPENIETKVLGTYRPGSGGAARPGRPARRPSGSGITALIHHSMLRLPTNPMTPREQDARVGFFSVGFEQYGEDERHQVETVRFITRWRLEKKDPSAAVSEVKKPIVFYVGRGVPAKWKPFVKKGIEMWRGAFEKAGFKNAIQGKIAPSPEQDPNWDAEDARISTIRWLPSTTQNAFGPHVSDPRTGEILEADVRVYHNILKLVRDWYYIQASPNDPRAQQLPMPDELVGDLLAYVIAHEVGHSLGFPHNMKASSSYAIKQLRDPIFTKKNGVEASIMDYGRFNYVAQPGDGAALIPVVGPYDDFAVAWGYGQYTSAKDEAAGQAALLAQQVDNPQLRFGSANPGEDPTRQTEDLGADSIEATRLGLLNIDRVAANLIKACCNKGEDYSLLQNMYSQLVRQRTRELMHVTGVVGGFERKTLFFGDADQVYHPISAARQKQAVAFLIAKGFQTPASLIDPKITLKLEAHGADRRILGSQSALLRTLISETRFRRMAEQVTRGDRGAGLYHPQELLADLRVGIWSELKGQGTVIDLYRRNLQRAYIQHMTNLAKSRSGTDLPALARAELAALAKSIGNSGSAEPVTRAHLDQALSDIRNALDPTGAERVAAPASSNGG